MASWRNRARLGVAVFGLAVAAIVYFGTTERQAAAPRPPVERTDPKAIFESKGGDFSRTMPESVNKLVHLEDVGLVQGYEDGTWRLTDINRITVLRGEREFVASGRQGRLGRDMKELEITGDVKLRASDGFELQTDRATYSESDGIARTPGAVTFSKGRMSGSGTGVSWDQNTDVLTIQQQAHVVTRNEDGGTTMELASASATLDRGRDLLQLNDGAHVVRDSQVIDARTAVANLTANEDVVTFIKLAGDARVTGAGSSIDAMTAREIDLDYTDDGASLEQVALRGSGAIAMTGQNGAAGRRIHGETLDLTLAPDGSLLRAIGRDKVQLDLPPAANVPARSIRAATLDAQGQAGRGLTAATFTGDVSFTEEAVKGAARRSAHSQELAVALSDDAVTSATFKGRASFEEEGLTAGAARVDYQPDKGTLMLSGIEGNIGPCVANDKVTVDAQTIDVTLQGQRFFARGNVKTTLRGEARRETTCGGRAVSTAASSPAASTSRLPGLLDQKANATVTAETLDYQGATGKATYTGRKTSPPTLAQGATVVRGDTITIDQASGDLTATGNAHSTIALDKQDSVGGAHEIRYVDAKRTVSYESAQPTPTATPGVPAPLARLVGPQGDLSARRIDIVLAETESRVEQISARQNVSILVEKTRTVSGADRLTYTGADGNYEVDGLPGRPLVWVEKDDTVCRENSGLKLRFKKDESGATLDGQGQRRFQTGPKPCPAALR
jgi:hypothetical protein